MIYLIDDQKGRQKLDYDWDESKFQPYNDIVFRIYNFQAYEDLKSQILSENNTVLYHESFLKGTERSGFAIEDREELIEFASSNSSFKLAIFSGSKDSRSLEENVAHLPDSVLYQNLEVFLRNLDLGLEGLLFGLNPDLEKDLSIKLKKGNESFNDRNVDFKGHEVLFLRDLKGVPKNQIVGGDVETLYSNFVGMNNIDEIEEFNLLFDKFLLKKKYDKIFIPLSFGEILSDFSGLTLALQIRCTGGVNQNTDLILYSFVGTGSFLNHKYFNVLKTKNILLCNHNPVSFLNVLNHNSTELKFQEISGEISKLNLEPPKYSHSIANEWAIYRWAKCLNIDFEDELESIAKTVRDNIYFKYLKTIYPIAESGKLDTNNIGLKKVGEPKVLYVDDDLNKGWNELLVQIIYDNGVSFESIGGDFKNLKKEEVIDSVISKFLSQDSDVVILDFRLIESDFNTHNIEDVTSIKILKRIKKINPGIQVLVFSATNKVWNYQSIMNAGADGFVIKESPENSIDPSFTINSIKLLVSQLNASMQRCFLKSIFNSISQVKNNLTSLDCKDDTDYDDFVLSLVKQVQVISESLKSIKLEKKSSLDVAFLNCFNFLEQFKNNYYLKFIDNAFVLGVDEDKMNEYYFDKCKRIINKGIYVPLDSKSKPSWFNVMSALFIDYFKICNSHHNLIKNLNELKEARNKFIHSTKSNFSREELIMIIKIMVVITSKIRE